jgi:lipopolysaccharide export system protein LptC
VTGGDRVVAAPWSMRLLDSASAYLPLLLMALLALGTWWLVKNTPLFDNERAAAPLRHEPDYTMSQFMVQRFAPEGAMRVQIEGALMRHYPDTDTLEIDNPRIRALAPDGRVTVATARSALSNGDGSEVQLSGGAHVVRGALANDAPIEFRGEFLHYFVNTERLTSHLPVNMKQGRTEVRADAFTFDNLSRAVDFKGRVRAVFAAPHRPAQ